MGKEEKLSFSFSSKTKPPVSSSSSKAKRRNPRSSSDETAEPQFFTVFDPTEAPPSGPSGLVIPPIPNSTDFRAGSIKKMKNLQSHDPSDPVASENKFVLEANSNSSQDDSNISYGLTLRSKQDQDHEHQDQEQDQDQDQNQERDLTLRRFREDMKNLPDDRGMDEFAEVPIESFAAAVLAGYGWSEGRGIGRNSTNTDTKVVQYDRRAGTQGLGYNPSLTTTTTTKKPSPLPPPPTRESKSRGEKGSDNRKKSPVRWLRSHIRVRVISKDFKRGKLYLKKGEVVDVVGPTTCDLSMDGSQELVQGVDQEALETAVPKPGGSVLVLYGKHKGVYGNLVERNMEKETGVVRDADTHSLINVRLEQIAEYVGDPAYLGY